MAASVIAAAKRALEAAIKRGDSKEKIAQLRKVYNDVKANPGEAQKLYEKNRAKSSVVPANKPESARSKAMSQAEYAKERRARMQRNAEAQKGQKAPKKGKVKEARQTPEMQRMGPKGPQKGMDAPKKPAAKPKAEKPAETPKAEKPKKAPAKKAAAKKKTAAKKKAATKPAVRKTDTVKTPPKTKQTKEKPATTGRNKAPAKKTAPKKKTVAKKTTPKTTRTITSTTNKIGADKVSTGGRNTRNKPLIRHPKLALGAGAAVAAGGYVGSKDGKRKAAAEPQTKQEKRKGMTGKAFYEAAGRAGKMEYKGGRTASRSGKNASTGGRNSVSSGTTKPKKESKYEKSWGEFQGIPQVQYRKRKKKKDDK